MKNTNNNNTPRAKSNNSFAQEAVHQSLLVAALDRYLGLRGFIPGVTDVINRVEYQFYHMQSGKLIKVFTKLDPKEFVRCEKSRPEMNPIYIVDAVALKMDLCKGRGKTHASIESKELRDAVTVFNPLLYFEDIMWEFAEEEDTWLPMMPIERTRCIEELSSVLN